MNQVGLIGLGTMGSNLMMNLFDQGFQVVAHSYSSTELTGATHTYPGPVYVESARALIAALQPPRRVLLMVTAGEAVDQVLQDLQPLLSEGDIVIDGGNSHFEDTNRRHTQLAKTGIHFVGCGISGGEAGARHGAALMPGGDHDALTQCDNVFTALAATVDGIPCARPIGRAGSGHFVKMVHNGIEYGVMQLLAELYAFAHRGCGYSNDECADLFAHLNSGRTASYLMEISADILRRQDDLGPGSLIQSISDKAAQKGTGKWTVDAALTLGVATPTINAAVTERLLSQQQRPAPGLPPTPLAVQLSSTAMADIEPAIHSLVFACYAQGFNLIQAASREYGWQIDLASVASIWRGGCIIRASLLNLIVESNGLQTEQLWRDNTDLAAASQLAKQMIETAIAAPATLATTAYLRTLSTAPLPTQLIQAQRDYFGRHGYERTDRSGSFHYPWSDD